MSLRTALRRSRRTRRVITATLAGSTAVVASTAVVIPAHADPSDGCAPYEIVAVPGTWETTSTANPDVPVGMLKTVTEQITNASSNAIHVSFLPYDATAFNQGVSYAASADSGMTALNKLLTDRGSRCSSADFGLIGYSQGADIAGDVAAAIANGDGPISKSKLRGTVLIADPNRGTPGEQPVGPNPPGHGIAGPREQSFSGIDVRTICAPEDLYCATPADDKLLNSLGSVLGSAELADSDKAPSNSADSSTASALGKLNPEGVQKNTAALVDAAESGDADGAEEAAQKLQKQTGMVGNIVDQINQGYAAVTLSDFSQESAQYRASTVLDTVHSVPVKQLSTLIDGIANGADSLDANKLTAQADQVAQLVAPLTGLGGSDVAAASRIIKGIQPVSLLRQAAQTTDKVAKIDFEGIIADLMHLGDLAANGNFPAMPDTVNALNAKLVGVVSAIDQVDLQPLINILKLMPPGTPPRIAGTVLSVLNHMDLTHIAQNVALAVKYVMSGDLLAIPPLILDTVATAVDTSGLLDGLDMGSVRNLEKSFTPENVTKSASQAIEFYSGGSHQDYGSFLVDDQGTDALTWSADWLLKHSPNGSTSAGDETSSRRTPTTSTSTTSTPISGSSTTETPRSSTTSVAPTSTNMHEDELTGAS